MWWPVFSTKAYRPGMELQRVIDEVGAVRRDVGGVDPGRDLFDLLMCKRYRRPNDGRARVPRLADQLSGQ